MTGTDRNRKYRSRVIGIAVILLLLIAGLFAGCGGGQGDPSATEAGQKQTSLETKATETSAEASTEASTDAGDIDPDGVYDSRDEVARYILLYGKLPKNYMTKGEARKLGWSGGSLEDYAEGMCIGGDRFGNYEGLLPDGDYRECDIDTLGKSSRGPKRIVFSDRAIYYTDDHYKSFRCLYER